MKTLLAVSALLAVALGALAFPDMNKLILVVPFLLSLVALASGCSSADFKRRLRELPDGHYDSVVLSQKNLGIGAGLTAENLTLKGDEISFTSLAAEANTPWTGTTTLMLKGGSMDVSPASRAKKPAIPPLTSGNSTPIPPGAFVPSPAIPPKNANAAPADPAPVAATAPAATGSGETK